VSEEGKKDLDLGPVDEEERKDLEFLMALIRRRLEGGKAAKT